MTKPAVVVPVDQPVRPAALTFADWLDGEACSGGTNWNRKIAGAANELRRQHSEAGQLRALLRRALPMASALDATKTAVVWTADLQCDASGLARDIKVALGA